ncbi:MAG: antifreeze protein [Rhodospirillaceae bacterium]|nr:antifreeze protein [Rhodospirillales bacterium]
MTVCRADRGSAKALRLLAAGLFATTALMGHAHAQGPLTTFDPDTMEMAEPAAPREAEVEIQTLKALSAESVGSLDQNHGGFANTLWVGTPAPVARRLIPLLPAGSNSVVVRDLERRLLLTAATAPDGAAEGDRPSLVELRAERLGAMGDADGVVALGNVASQAVAGPLLQRARLDALLLAGNTQGACADAQRLGTAEGSLAKLQILCNFMAGKILEGNLALDLMRDRKDADHAFMAAAETVSGLPPLPADKVKLAELTPLHVAAFAAAKMPLPADAVAKAPPSVARAVALSFATPFDVRLAAGERAFAAGVLPAESLRKLYLEAVFAPDELSAPLVRAETAGTRGQALLFRAATDQPDPLIRAHFVAKALELASTKGQTAATARLFAGLLAEAKPSPALITVAPAFARANFALGLTESATAWLELAKTDPAAAKAVERLWPLAAVHAAGPGQALPVMNLAAWRATLDGLPPEIAARRTAVVLGSLSALGAKVPETAWLDTLSLPAGGPKPALFALLQSAALEAKLGSTVLAVLTAMGEQPLDKLDVITLSEAISALSVVGLGEDARKLAIEAMLANGV